MSTETKSKTRSAKTVSESSMNEDVKKPIIAKDIDLNQMIVVRNGFQGRLIYKSSRTQERFVWSDFGDEVA